MVLKNIALGRIAEPEEIANLVSFYVQVRFIHNWSIYKVDGGLRI